MLRIDDPEFIRGLDGSRMLHFLEQLPEVAQAAYERGRAATLPLVVPDRILICGMGGSAISADLIRTQLIEHCAIPVLVHRGDSLPRHADERTLAIFMSYSGNTGETLGCLRDAILRGIPSVVITGGGTAGQLAIEHDLPTVALPGGWQPRAALGDLFFALLGVVSQVDGLAPPDVAGTVKRLRALRERFVAGIPTDRNPAKGLALAIHGKIPLIVGGTANTEAVALRWKCQFNENGKQTALFAVLPEMTHNDIVNLTARPHHDHVILVCTDPADSEFLRRQRGHALDIIGPHVAEVLEIRGEGESLLERQLTAIYLGDWVSVYLGLLNGFDPTPVDAIGTLKQRMAGAGAHA